MTQNEAAQKFVNGFNAVPTEMIRKLWQADPDDWHEVTCPFVGNKVSTYDSGSGEIIEVGDEDNQYKIALYNGDEVLLDLDQFDVERGDVLPMWGLMWSFSDSADNNWLKDGDGIRKMSECGFRIYESEEFGYYFGIDGAGYDFYEQHWIPLYKIRGLHWHDEEGAVAE